MLYLFIIVFSPPHTLPSSHAVARQRYNKMNVPSWNCLKIYFSDNRTLRHFFVIIQEHNLYTLLKLKASNFSEFLFCHIFCKKSCTGTNTMTYFPIKIAQTARNVNKTGQNVSSFLDNMYKPRH